jgi:hypothetical protein
VYIYIQSLIDSEAAYPIAKLPHMCPVIIVTPVERAPCRRVHRATCHRGYETRAPPRSTPASEVGQSLAESASAYLGTRIEGACSPSNGGPLSLDCRQPCAIDLRSSVSSPWNVFWAQARVNSYIGSDVTVMQRPAQNKNGYRMDYWCAASHLDIDINRHSHAWRSRKQGAWRW